MKTKKMIFISFMLFVSLLFINPLIIVKDTDEVDKAYIKETYGKGLKGSIFSAEQMAPHEFDSFKKSAMEDAAYNKDLNDAQRKDLMVKLKGMKFKPMKMVFFKITAAEPILPDDLKFNVKLLNAKSESLSIFDYYQAFKVVNTSTVMGIPVSTTSYVYYWIIESDKQLVKKNFTSEEMPVKFIIEFPNKQKRTYIAKM